jgi:hypothetical protein
MRNPPPTASVSTAPSCRLEGRRSGESRDVPMIPDMSQLPNVRSSGAEKRACRQPIPLVRYVA